MSKALCSFAVGQPHEAMLALALPRFEAYARRHGYDLCISAPPGLRPASWAKVPRLLGLLEDYDAVLWLDADVLIVDGSHDLAAEVPAPAVMALARHHTGEGVIPNCGVWFVRQTAVPLLRKLLGAYEAYREHKWWEQGALIDLMGDTPTHWLGSEWNWHAHDRNRVDRPRFKHFTALPDRLEAMRRDANV